MTNEVLDRFHKIIMCEIEKLNTTEDTDKLFKRYNNVAKLLLYTKDINKREFVQLNRELSLLNTVIINRIEYKSFLV